MKRIHSVFSLIVVCFCLLMWAGPLWAEYVNNGNGTVTDTSTGLTWQQDVPEDVVTWEEALAYCESLDFGGESDWRLPTIKELRSLADYSRVNPSIDITFFQNTPPSFFWSSTTYAYNISSAWSVFFEDGSGISSDKSSISRVRAVRGGQAVSVPPIPDVKVNGQDGPLTVSSETTVSITASLMPEGDNGKSADWWLVIAAFGNLYSLTANGWEAGILPLIQFPLFPVPQVPVYSGLLPVGDYAFCFGVDTSPNNLLDVPLYFDWVEIHVTD
ncbi:MAG: DUF1566 domain-containing protein [Desulfatirhabdiaceae bacterium]